MMAVRKNPIDDRAGDITGAIPKNKPTVAEMRRMYAERIPPRPRPIDTPPPRGGVGEMFRVNPPRPPVARDIMDERRYSSGAPAFRAPEDYISEGYANALLPSLQPSYDPLAFLAGLFPQGSSGGSGGGGGGGRRGGGGGGMAGPSKADINEAIQAMQAAADVAKTNIAGYYTAADQALADMVARYAASEAATRQAAGRTLGAFGVEGGTLDPMAQSAGDYLTASRGTLAGMSADQQARLEAQKAAYALILGDMAGA